MTTGANRRSDFAGRIAEGIMMKSEDNVQKAAQEMLDRYGTAAVDEVQLRISELRASGKDQALTLWIEIGKAIQSLSEHSG